MGIPRATHTDAHFSELPSRGEEAVLAILNGAVVMYHALLGSKTAG